MRVGGGALTTVALTWTDQRKLVCGECCRNGLTGSAGTRDSMSTTTKSACSSLCSCASVATRFIPAGLGGGTVGTATTPRPFRWSAPWSRRLPFVSFVRLRRAILAAARMVRLTSR